MPLPTKRINVELHLSLSAVFLSLAALVVSIVQTKIARDQQHASVWPRIMTSSSVLDLNFYFTIANQCVGPAIVKSVDTFYKGRKYATLSELLFQQTGHLDGGFLFGDLEPETVLKAGDEYELFKLTRNDEPLSYKLRKVTEDSSFHFRIRYADVYGNCWLLDQNKVTELDKCPNQ